jgi:hypothetical protein
MCATRFVRSVHSLRFLLFLSKYIPAMTTSSSLIHYIIGALLLALASSYCCALVEATTNTSTTSAPSSSSSATAAPARSPESEDDDRLKYFRYILIAGCGGGLILGLIFGVCCMRCWIRRRAEAERDRPWNTQNESFSGDLYRAAVN